MSKVLAMMCVVQTGCCHMLGCAHAPLGQGQDPCKLTVTVYCASTSNSSVCMCLAPHLGRVQDPSKLTVTVCGHYDVADALSEDGWRTPPFELTAANGNLYGRGVSTSKGPLVAALFAVKVCPCHPPPRPCLLAIVWCSALRTGDCEGMI